MSPGLTRLNDTLKNIIRASPKGSSKLEYLPPTIKLIASISYALKDKRVFHYPGRSNLKNVIYSPSFLRVFVAFIYFIVQMLALIYI
jgi:hypothetical protein